MESVASTLDFIRKQSAARRCDYKERWRSDGDVDADADATGGGGGGGGGAISDNRPASHSLVERESRPLNLLSTSLACGGDHKYEYAVSPTAAATVGRSTQQRCVVEYSSGAADFIGRERSVSSYVRATATDASVYSRASYSEYSLPSSAPTTRSTSERLHRAGTLLQGLSYAELDLPINADAVDRLRAKLDRLSSENDEDDKRVDESLRRVDVGVGAKKRLAPRSAVLNNNRPVGLPSIVDCVANGAMTSAVDTLSVASLDRRRPFSTSSTSRPTSAISAISSASQFSSIPTKKKKKRPHPTTLCVFDPAMMQGSRRTALKAAKRAKAEAAAKAEEGRKRLFKARPLPCGGTVTSNLFAPTKASISARASAMANINNSVSASPVSFPSVCHSRPGTSHSRASRASFSSLPVSLSRCPLGPRNRRNDATCSSTCSPKSLSSMRSPPTRKARRNTAKRRRLLAEIDAKIRTEMDVAIVPYDEAFANDNDDVSVASDGNDMSTLQHQIAILEAQLRQTRSYNERIMDEIEALDNLEDIDYMTITFDQDDDDSGRCRAQNYAYDETPRDNSHHRFLAKRSNPLSPSSAVKGGTPSNDSLYHRQEQWVSTVEKKLDDARLKKADRIMSGFTGKPQIASTEGSWQRAKAAHDFAARRAREEQERKNKSRDGQEQEPETFGDTKPSFIDQKKEEAKPPSKQTMGPVDKKKQADYSERLARPRSIAVPPGSGPKPVGRDNDKTDTKEKMMIQRSPFLPSNDDRKAATASRRTPTVDALFPTGGGTPSFVIDKKQDPAITASNVSNDDTLVNEKSFADMNDREFSHVMRRLGIKSVPKADGKKNKKNPSATNLLFATLDSKTASKLPIEAYLGTSPTSNNKKRPPAKTPVGGGRFVSSEAQANLFKIITDRERGLVTSKMGGPARSTGTVFFSNTTSFATTPVTVTDHLSHGATACRAGVETASSSTDLASDADNSEEEPSTTRVLAEVKQIGQVLSFKEPYQRYEAGQAPFFDKSSSDERGRFRVRDASSFDPNSMRRIVGPDSDADGGVMFLVGGKWDEKGCQRKEFAITVLFDRRKWNEEDAEHWWRAQRHRFIDERTM